MSKLIVVLLVFIIVFNPKKLPLLINDIAKFNLKFNKLRRTIFNSYHEILKNEQSLQALEENNMKAEKADLQYKNRSLT
ncbi:MAG: hypothetical protein A3E88_02080 [Legionellales bacterium RIFCSPHIGHO2_12_FULL_35_11]|nr:MAG: hypothetical protein A3E88_02080 [Legionellales bacterium RIFCSPHIGHO2_12_FULL_35_11]